MPLEVFDPNRTCVNGSRLTRLGSARFPVGKPEFIQRVAQRYALGSVYDEQVELVEMLCLPHGGV
jgi:hypothetical protein